MAADPIELLNHRKGGSEFWVELHITPVADDIGWYRYWVSVQRETDERRHFDGQRRLYTLILANVSDGILVADALRPNFPIEFANAGFTRMTGYTQADLLDLNGRLLQGPETDPVARQQLRRGIERQVSVTTEILVLPDNLWAIYSRSEHLARVAHRVGRAFVASDARPPPWSTLHCLQGRQWHFSNSL